MRIQHNIAALNSYRNLTGNNNAVSKNLEKLSSGYRINRAGDDAAGLAISEKMRAQITGLNTAQKNAQDGVSLVQTAEGALTEVHSMLNRMVELADQSANGTYDNPVDRANLQKEIASLKDEIDRIADSTNFNGINLLDGSLSTSTTSTLNGTTTGTKAAVDLKFTFADQFKGKDIKVNIANKANGGDAIDVEVAADGSTITLKMDATKDHSASAIKEALAKAKLDAVKDNDDKAKMTSLLASATVTGAGTTALANGDGFAMETGKTTAAKGKSLTLQIGDTSKDFNQMAVSVGDMHGEALGIADIDISTQVGAQTAVDKIKSAINSVSSTRGDLGAIQNRLEHTINNLSVTAENMTAAESRIRDVDMANEMMAYTKNNILVQSSQAMLAQANQLPQGVLQLLQ